MNSTTNSVNNSRSNSCCIFNLETIYSSSIRYMCLSMMQQWYTVPVVLGAVHTMVLMAVYTMVPVDVCTMALTDVCTMVWMDVCTMDPVDVCTMVPMNVCTMVPVAVCTMVPLAVPFFSLIANRTHWGIGWFHIQKTCIR